MTMKPIRFKLFLCCILTMPMAVWAEQPTVRVEPSHLQGPRVLESQTATAVVRDYLQCWQSMRTALEQNRADLLDADFVGIARDKLANTVREQSAMGIHTRYLDRSHDLRIVFFSPDGLSIQLIDNVEYEEQVLDHDKLLSSQHVRARYIVVLSPAERSWRVRIFQGQSE